MTDELLNLIEQIWDDPDATIRERQIAKVLRANRQQFPAPAPEGEAETLPSDG